MNTHTLKIFCDVIDTSSFSETAKLNFVTQSAVSQQINALEDRFDDKLFNRNKGNYEVTSAGAILYKYAKSILASYDQMEEDIRASKHVMSGKIRLSTIYSIGLHELPHLVKDFMLEYPEINLHVEYARMDQVIYDVTSSSVDLGIVAYPKENHMVDVIPFRTDHLICIVGPNHPFKDKKRISIKDLDKQKFISFSSEIPTGVSIKKELDAHQINVEMVMDFDNIETIKRAVEIDTGLSVVPRVTVQNELKLGTLHALEFSDFIWERPIGIVLKKGKEPHSIAKLFLDFLQKNKAD